MKKSYFSSKLPLFDLLSWPPLEVLILLLFLEFTNIIIARFKMMTFDDLLSQVLYIICYRKHIL
jgi:hypothetical protein